MTVRVCHLIHGLGPGGAEHVLVDLARASAGQVDMSVVSLMPSQGAEHVRELRDLGVPVGTLDLAGRWDPRGFARATAAIAPLRPDVLHSHMKHADLVGARVAATVGVPLVSTLHLVEDAVTPVGRVKRRLAARARMRAAAHTVTVSDALRRWYLATFGADAGRVSTVRNGVLPPAALPESRRLALRAEAGAGAGTVLVTCLGIMRPGKGHAQLLRAVERLPEAAGVRVALAGDGPLRARLRRAVASSPVLRDRVTLLGFRRDVGALLQASDVVVQPSLSDALPTSLIHALAAGVPAVASAVGGIPEIVTPATGVLVPPGDVGALATALLGLAEEPGRRQSLGAAARSRFDREFDARVWAERLRRLYERVLADTAAVPM
ncbi:glycosyltransferase family 4 protein [soil metagenome]